jgi:hypothetical protein
MARIELWHDNGEIYRPSDPKWIVSLCDDDGIEIKCLGSFHEEEKAKSFAGKESNRLRLSLVDTAK